MSLTALTERVHSDGAIPPGWTWFLLMNWRWDNPRTFGEHVDRCNPQTSSSGKVQRTGEHFSWYGSDDLRAKIELPCCRQYKLGDNLALRPLNWDDIIDENDNDENWADPSAPSRGWRCPSDGNHNGDGEGEEDR